MPTGRKWRRNTRYAIHDAPHTPSSRHPVLPILPLSLVREAGLPCWARLALTAGVSLSGSDPSGSRCGFTGRLLPLEGTLQAKQGVPGRGSPMFEGQEAFPQKRWPVGAEGRERARAVMSERPPHGSDAPACPRHSPRACPTSSEPQGRS